MSIKLCECGCKGTPKPGNRFIHGHNMKKAFNDGKEPWNKGKTAETDAMVARLGNCVLRETRTCKCGCGGTFICKVTSKQRFLNGHNRRLSRETRYCECGCGTSFECTITSKQRFIIGHSTKGVQQSQEMRDKRSKANRKPETRKKIGDASRERWSSMSYRERTFQAMAEGMKVFPNKPETIIQELLNSLFPNEYKYVGDRQFWVCDYKYNPDFISTNGQKKIIEHFGDRWHANKEFCKAKGITEVEGIPVEDIRKNNKKRLCDIRSSGYETLVIWEHELEDMNKVENKIKEFHKVIT